MILIGTAGWSIPRAAATAFPGLGSHLERYARILPCAEINSSFHRPHAANVYARWAAATPPGFRFSVKLPRTITHDAKLRRSRPLLDAFFGQIAGLGPKLGALLVQLPPSLAFDLRVARSFFETLRDRFEGPVVCEPRHATWFDSRADEALVGHRIARVATDPSRIAAALHPGGWMPYAGAVIYYRLHGSPRTYWSRYPQDRLRQWADELASFAVRGDAWCIFDNTASGAAIENALEVTGLLAQPVAATLPSGRRLDGSASPAARALHKPTTRRSASPST